MAKYKKGTIELDESVVGAKTPEDWASQGFTKMADTPTPQGDNNATLTSADKAQKTIVGIGSEDANKLLSKGWTIGAEGTSVMDLPSAFDYSPTTKKDDAITSDVLKSEGEEITIPPTDKAEDTGEATIAGAQEQMKSISDYIKEVTPPQGEKAEEAETLTGEISKLLEETQGRQEMLQAEEKARGVSSIEEQIKNINNEMSIKVAQYQKLHADIQSKPITMASIIGQQAQTRAVMQADIGFLQARASALQNNLTFAQDQAEKAVDDKYTPILEELKIKQDQLNLLQPALSKEENLYATALNRQYADQQAKIEEQKETEKGVKKIALQILANTGDNALASQVENAQTVMEAMQIGGRLATEEGWEYVNTPAKRDQLIAQGYETIQAGGRTYARKGGGETVQAYVNQIKSGRIKLNSVPADIRNQVAVELGDSDINIKKDTQVIKTEDGKSLLINTQTGETIKTYGGDGQTDPITGTTSDPTKVISGYDFTSYATDPNWGNSVSNIFDNIKFNTVEEMDNYIQSIAPNSAITGDMIENVSREYGINWEILTAIMQQESQFGTAGVGAKTFNPGNVGNTDSGATTNWANWTNGIRAVARNINRRKIADAKDLTPQEITAGNKLAKDLYGASTIKTKDGREAFVEPILDRMRMGETIDGISDDLRLKGQSIEFTGYIRDAAQQITSKLSDKKTQTIFDKVDDLVGREDQGALRDYLKKTAVDAAGMEQGKQIMGQERTVEFLDEIWNDLKAFESGGGDTNIFTGTIEEILRKAGTVKEPELRKLAVKITKARQQYRRAMTGVAFSPGENLEYDKIFPDINKTAEFNTSVIKGLQEAFRGDVDFFYKFQMGQEAYDEIFKQGNLLESESLEIDDSGISDDDAYNLYLQIINQ